MKKLVLSVVLTSIIAAFTASAKTGESVKNIKSVDYVLAAQTVGSEQHLTLMDKIQRETEDLIVTIAPPPLLSLAHFINKKIDAAKVKRANKRHKAKKEENSFNCR